MSQIPGRVFRTTVFGARLLIAFAIPPLVFAHEPHPPNPAIPVTADENSFLKENEAAMTKMMNDMAARPTGDVDRDFVAIMAPHHQGAIDMAVIELRYGKNEQLRRIAQEIIVNQTQEIAAMNIAIGARVPDSEPVPTQSEPATAASQHGHATRPMDMSPGMKK